MPKFLSGSPRHCHCVVLLLTIALFILGTLIGCDQEQKMIQPVLMTDDVAETGAETEVLPEPELTTTITFEVDGVEHQTTVWTSAEAAMNSERFQNLLPLFREWSEANCGKLEKDFHQFKGVNPYEEGTFTFEAEADALAFAKLAMKLPEVNDKLHWTAAPLDSFIIRPTETEPGFSVEVSPRCYNFN